MIKLAYSLQEMISALEKVGYTIKKETEVETVSYYQEQTQDVEQSVYNVYYKGNRIDLWDYLYGSKRLEAVFEQEVRKHILSLF